MSPSSSTPSTTGSPRSRSSATAPGGSTTIGGLRDLLRVAAAQGMAVILTSDHGHVVDRHGTKVDAATEPASARHRTARAARSTRREIALSGPRVVWPEPGGAIVALWDADSRYTALKAGYHGGAALAEFTIPVLAFLPFGAEPPKGWRELGDQRPPWWSLDEAGSRVRRPCASRPARLRRRRREARNEADRPGAGDALFDVVAGHRRR